MIKWTLIKQRLGTLIWSHSSSWFTSASSPGCLQTDRQAAVSSSQTDRQKVLQQMFVWLQVNVVEKLQQVSWWRSVTFLRSEHLSLRLLPGTIPLWDKETVTLTTGGKVEYRQTVLKLELEIYFLSDSVINWFESYLQDRDYFVSLGNYYTSKQTKIKCGVPQGSILGPLLSVLKMDCRDAGTYGPLLQIQRHFCFPEHVQSVLL